jgi:splicing factor 3B subunit 2
MLGSGDIEYVFESLEAKDAALDEFSNVFARFKPPPDSTSVRALVHALLRLTF